MLPILLPIIVILSIIIIILVMLQSKGTGLSIVPGTDDGFGKFERRGAEKTMHTITISLVVLFVLACTLYYFFS